VTFAARAQLNLAVVSARRHNRARMTKYTGTEVRGESDITSHRNEPTPRNSDLEGSSDFLSLLAQISLVTLISDLCALEAPDFDRNSSGQLRQAVNCSIYQFENA